MNRQGYWINRVGLLRYRFTVETSGGHFEGSRLTHFWANRAARHKIHKMQTRTPKAA